MKSGIFTSALNNSWKRPWLAPVLVAFLAPAAMNSQVLAPGDVVVAEGGLFHIYNHNGLYKGVIGNVPARLYYTATGCAFNTDFSKLYAVDYQDNLVRVYDATGTVHPELKAIDTSAGGTGHVSSLVFDHAGNWYVSHHDGSVGVIKYSPNDVPLMFYYPQTDFKPGGLPDAVDYLDISKDGNTLFYTDNSGQNVKRFDVATNTQLPAFSGPLPVPYHGVERATELRLLPPYDGSGGLLVVDPYGVRRLDGSGNVIQTYDAVGQIRSDYHGSPNNIALDPSGTSFWVEQDEGEGQMPLLYRFNIATGMVEIGPISGSAHDFGELCVRGGTVTNADTTPPAVSLVKSIAGPPRQVVLASQDTESGLKSIAVVECSNCTAVNDAFTPGTNLPVTTTATRTNPNGNASIKLQVTDMAGNTATFDPVDFEISEEGGERRKTVDISPEETKIILSNGTPGIHTIKVRVNGTELPAIHLENGASDTIDISKDIVQGIQNQVTLSARGHIHGTAWVVITQP